MSKLKTVGDVIEIGAKTALSVIPVGGALATAVYETVKGNALEKRSQKWRSTIEERLSSLETTLDKLGADENFATMLIKTTELAMKTQKEEKLSYLANALKNSINSTMDEDKAIIFMALLEKYTVSHIKVLEQQSREASEMNVPFFSKIFTDLYNDGLLSSQQDSLRVMRITPLGKITTTLGDDFLSMISLV